MNTNYPDLYVQHTTTTTTTIVEPVPSTPEPLSQPGASLYKSYASGQSCVLCDEFQNFAKGLVKLDSTVNPKTNISLSSSTTTTTSTQVCPDGIFQFTTETKTNSSPLWSILEFFTEALLAYNRTPSTYVEVNVNSKNSSSVKVEKSKESNSLSVELETLRSEIKNMKKEVEKLTGSKKKEKEKELEKLEGRLENLGSKSKESKDAEDEARQRLFRILIGSFSALSIPLLAYISGKELGTILFVIQLRKVESEFKKLLKKSETTENGKFNPHHEMCSDAVKKWKQVSTKLMWHSGISLFTKMAMVGSAFAGVTGSLTNQNTAVICGSVGFLAGLATYLIERMRYKSFDESDVKENVHSAATVSSLLLQVREPFVVSKKSSFNPEL